MTAGVSGAQQPVVIPPSPVTDASSPRFGADSRTDDPSVLLANEKRAKELNVLRQKEMTSDAAKLLLLATELKASVDKEGDDAATPERMHKAEQIEKLARSVRTRMTDAVGY